MMYCEPTAKGTRLGNAAGKEDPVELHSSEIKAFVIVVAARWGNCARPLTFLMNVLIF